MTRDQAIQCGQAFAQAHLEVVAAAYGPAVASSYAKGMAAHCRDLIMHSEGQDAAAFWFMCLGQDSIVDAPGPVAE